MKDIKYITITFLLFFLLSGVCVDLFADESISQEAQPEYFTKPYPIDVQLDTSGFNIHADMKKPFSNYTGRVDRKDPFLAGLLSWFMMGIGQIYCKEYTKGSLFIALDLVDKTTMILLISYINTKYTPGKGEVLYLNWKAFDDSTKVMVISYILAKVGIRFYNVVDAINSANSYNNRYSSETSKNGKFGFGLTSNSFVLDYQIRLK